MNIPRLSIQRPIGTVALFLSFILFGCIALFRMDMDLFPKIEYPAITIITSLENKSPKEIRNLVTVPMEEILSSTPGLKNIQSVSRYGESRITLYFDWGVNMDMVYMETREKLDFAKSALPQGSSRPIALQFDPNSEATLSLGVNILNSRLAGNEWSYLKKNLIPLLERIDGVAYVQILGGDQRIINVNVDLDKLYANSLSIDDIVSTLEKNNIDYPVGYIAENDNEYSVRIEGKLNNIYSLNQLVIGRNDKGIPIYLETVAEVEEQAREKYLDFRLKGTNAVSLRLYKEGDANIVKTARSIKEALPDISKKFNQDIELSIIDDNSLDISSSVRNIFYSALIGMLLAFVVLYAFLKDAKASLIAGAAIPLSIILTFFFMQMLGISINLISLSGLSIGIGMMVDANIVVMENIKRYQHIHHDLAMIKAVEEVQAPVFSSILTNIAVFLPVVFIQGIASSIFKELALVVTFSLLSSLLTSISLTPALYKLFMRKKGAQAPDKDNPLLIRLQHLYEKSLEEVIHRPKRYLMIILGLFIAAGISFSLLKQEVLPDLSQGDIRISLAFPPNYTLDKTREELRGLEAFLNTQKEIADYYAILGNGELLSSSKLSRQTHLAQIEVQLKRGKKAGRSIKNIQEYLSARYPQVQNEVKSGDTVFTKLFPSSSQIYIQGTPLEYLERLAQSVSNMLYQEGISNSHLSMEKKQVLSVYFDRAALNQSGLSTKYLADIAQISLNGKIATSMEDYDKQDLEVMVRLSRSVSTNKLNLKKILVRDDQKNTFSLENLIHLSNMTRISEIHRRDQQELVTVSFDAQGVSLKKIQNKVNQLSYSRNALVNYSWDSPETKKSVRSLLLALILSIVVIFVIIAFQFESVVKPVIIMLSIPLVFIGIMPVFLLTGTSINVISLMGAILLGGIVVNNAIVLVDFFERNKYLVYRKSNLEQLVVEGALTRLRPILMTSLTTIVSLLPLIIFPGRGMEFQKVLSITIVSGFLISTVITMFFIPTVYYLWERRRYP